MERQQFINSAKKMLSKGHEDDSMVCYLKEDGAKPDEISAIIETARVEFLRINNLSLM